MNIGQMKVRLAPAKNVAVGEPRNTKKTQQQQKSSLFNLSSNATVSINGEVV